MSIVWAGNAETLICAGDLHIRKSKPSCRNDDFWKTCQRKVRWLVDLVIDKDAALMVAGDLFDSYLVGIEVVNFVLDEFRRIPRDRLFIIAGQHDLDRHRLQLELSPLFVLGDVARFPGKLRDGNVGTVAGASWGEDIPEDGGILLLHKSVTNGQPPFYLPDAVDGNRLIEDLDYRLIISGDFHEPFMIRSGLKLLINTGPMLRLSSNEVELRPRVWEVDLDTLDVDQHFYPIETEVFVSNKLPALDDKDLRFTELAKALKESPELLRDFKGLCLKAEPNNKYLKGVLENVN